MYELSLLSPDESDGAAATAGGGGGVVVGATGTVVTGGGAGGVIAVVGGGDASAGVVSLVLAWLLGGLTAAEQPPMAKTAATPPAITQAIFEPLRRFWWGRRGGTPRGPLPGGVGQPGPDCGLACPSLPSTSSLIVALPDLIISNNPHNEPKP
jgi:hypothetical protein